MNIEIEEENYTVYLNQKYKDRARERTREKYRKVDNKYDKLPIREYDIGTQN